MGRKSLDLIGKSFYLGRVVEKKDKRSDTGKILWLLVCECGNKYTAMTNQLTSGGKKSCGCLKLRSGKDSPHYKGGKYITGTLFSHILHGAKSREYSFNLTIEYLEDLWLAQNGLCALSGIIISLPESQRGFHNREYTASLDRKNNSLGYEKGNVQWVHKHINLMKWKHNTDYFLELCSKVSRYNEQ